MITASGIVVGIFLVTENPKEQAITGMLYLVLSHLGGVWFLLQQFGDPAFPNDCFHSKIAGDHTIMTLEIAII